MNGTRTERGTYIRDGVSIESASEERIPEISQIQSDFLGSKKFCCLLPCSACWSESQMREEFRKFPDKMNVGGLACDEQTNEPLGYIQLVFWKMPDDLHKVRCERERRAGAYKADESGCLPRMK